MRSLKAIGPTLAAILVMLTLLYVGLAEAVFPYRNPKANKAATVLYLKSVLLFRRVDAFQP